MLSSESLPLPVKGLGPFKHPLFLDCAGKLLFMTIASAMGEGKEVGEEGKEEVRRKKVKREREKE